MNTLPFNSSSTGAAPGVWPWNSPPPSELPEYEFDFREQAVHLPAAGMTTLRSKMIGGKAKNKDRLDKGEPGEFAIRQNVYCGPGQEKVASRSHTEPSRYQSAAGQKSDRTVTSIHQNLHDLEAQLAKVHPNPKAAVSDRLKKRGDSMERMVPDELAAKEGVLVEGRKKGNGQCGIQCERTDPITHFKHEGVAFNKYWWRPARRYNSNNRARAQTWTWQQHQGRGEKKLDENSAWYAENKVHDTGDLVTCRGERIYNLCGAEDMLPAALAAYIKCDKPPSKAQIVRNDKKHWPVCAQDSPPREKNNYNESDEVWSMFCRGAWSTDAIEEAKQAAEKEARTKAELLKRPQSARPVLQTTGTEAPHRHYQLRPDTGAPLGSQEVETTMDSLASARRRPSSEMEAEDSRATVRRKASRDRESDTRSNAQSEYSEISSARVRRRGDGYDTGTLQDDRIPSRRSSSNSGGGAWHITTPRQQNVPALGLATFESSEPFNSTPQRPRSAPSLAPSVASSAVDRRFRSGGTAMRRESSTGSTAMRRESSTGSLGGRKKSMSSTGDAPFVPRCAMSRSSSVPSLRSPAARRSPSVSELSMSRWH